VKSSAATFDLSWRLVRDDGRPSAGVAFDEAIVAFFLEAVVVLDVPKSVAAIYGICFASAEPLSFSEVKQRLNISAGSIDLGLCVLRDVGAPKTFSRDLDRRELFTPDLELRTLVSHYLEAPLQRQLKVGRVRLGELNRLIPNGTNGRVASAKLMRHRLVSLQHWRNRAAALLPIIRTFLKLG